MPKANDDMNGVGLAEPFPRGGDTIPPPDWAYDCVCGLEVLDFRPNENVEYRLFRFTIRDESEDGGSLSSDTSMNLERMR